MQIMRVSLLAYSVHHESQDMALTYSDKTPLGSRAPDFALPGTDGVIHRLNDFRNMRAIVVVFMCNHCPYVKAVLDRINSLAKEYALRKVQVIGINPNDETKYPDDSFEAMRKLAAEKQLAFLYLRDESQQTARNYGAVCTPDFYVYERGPHPTPGEPEEVGHFQLRYRGRLDDNWKDPAQVKRRDLALALDEILAGHAPSPDQIPSMGCSIKWK